MKTRRIRLRLDKGIHEGQEPTTLGEGWLRSCLNYVPEPSGGVRARRGWLKASTNGAPSTRKGWGIGHFATTLQPPSIRQTKTNTAGPDSSPPTSVAVTFDSVPLAGNLLVARVYWLADSPAAGTSVTVTPPSGWVLAVGPGSTSRAAHCWIYYKENCAASAGPYSFSLNSNEDEQMVALEASEVRGIAVSSALDKTASNNNGTSTSPVSGTTATQSTDDGIAIAAFANADTGGPSSYSSPTNGFTATTEFDLQVAADEEGVFRGSYEIYSDNGAQSTGFTLSPTPDSGVGMIATFKARTLDVTGGSYIVANNAGATQLDIYRIDRETLESAPWELLESLAVAPDAFTVAFTAGLGGLHYVHPSFANMRRWTGTGSPTTTTGPTGRFIVFHNQRMWVGGLTGRESDLFYSEVGDSDTWDTTDPSGNFVPVSRNDGETLEDATPFGGGLVIAKQTTTWFLEGNDKHDFGNQLVGHYGAAPGRTVMATPIGVIIAGRRHVSLWDGGTQESISKPIEDTYGLTGNWMSVSRIDDSVYILDQGSAIMWCLDLKSGSWRTEQIGSGGDSAAVMYNQDFRHLVAPTDGTSAWNSLLAYREFPGTPRDKDFDTLTQTFEVSTVDVQMAGPSYALSPAILHVQIRQRGGVPENTGITVTPLYDGVAEDWSYEIRPRASAGVFVEHISLPMTGGLETVGFEFTQTLLSGEHSLMDIEGPPELECDIQDRVG